MKFTELGLAPEILRSVADQGYETPTPIQAQAIPVVLSGRDLMACAQTGTTTGGRLQTTSQRFCTAA